MCRSQSLLLLIIVIQGSAGAQVALSDLDRADLWRLSPRPGSPLAVEAAWPAPEAFEALWKARADHPPLRLLRGRVQALDYFDAVSDVVLRQVGARWVLDFIEDRTQVDGLHDLMADLLGNVGLKVLEGCPDVPGVLRLGNDAPDLMTIDVSRIAPRPPPTDSVWAAWVYAHTLLAADPDRPDDARIPANLCRRARPTEFASEEAAKALAAGRLGRFLRMSVMLLGDHLSSWTVASEIHGVGTPDADPLESAPIDVERFLLGLVMSLESGSYAAVSPVHLGRAIARSEHFAPMDARLRSVVADPRIDEWNRVRALLVLATALRHRPSEGAGTGDPRELEDVAPWLAGLPMPGAARRWLGLR